MNLSRLRRRPSGAMVVATTALVVASSGVGYAAVSLPSGSVGTSQLRNGSVTNFKLASNSVGFRKIIPHTIGRVRVDQNTVQLRVTGTCSGTGQAIGAIANTGKVSCARTGSSEYDTPGLNAKLTSATSGTLLASVPLPPGNSYLVNAAPYIGVAGASGVTQQVVVTCELADGSSTQTRSVTFELAPGAENQTASIPLTVTVPSGASATTAAVGCIESSSGSGGAPTVAASGGINALQTAANTSTTTPTTTTPYSAPITTPTPARRG